MRWRPQSERLRLAGSLAVPAWFVAARVGLAVAALAGIVVVALFGPAGAAAAARVHPAGAARLHPASAARFHPAGGARLHPTASARGEAARVMRWWTPARMRAAVPLDAAGALGGAASASYAPIAEPTVQPYAVEGRVFVRQGPLEGFCSGTAIDSPSRRLVLTAGHCVNSGPGGFFPRPTWSRYAMFVPAYSNGVAPFGAFVAHRNSIFALPRWVRVGNPNYDVGALLVSPNAEGVNVADAVGGGAKLALDLNRQQQFQTFGYPNPDRWMQGCESPYVGDDANTYRLPGPPTMAIRCHWAPGASGGGWLIGEGKEIDGLTSYGRPHDRLHTFGPYFSSTTVGYLVAGM